MAIEFKCQNCQKTLRVADEFAGKKARCPNCQTILLVESDTETVEPIAVKPPVASAPQPPAYGQTGTPSASPFATGNPYSSPAQASQYRTPTRRHSRGEPHRAGLVFGLGIGAIVCNICLIPGILALTFGLNDLKAMKEGRMDNEGHGLTLAGTIMGGIMTGLAALGLLFYAVLIVISIVARA